MDATLVLEFNREVNYGKDFISPGSFTILTRDGKRKQFDFIRSYHNRYVDKPNCVKIEMLSVDPEYEDGADVTVSDIMDIDRFEEIFINISNNDLTLKDIVSFTFEGKTRGGRWLKCKLDEARLKQAKESTYIQYEP